MKHFASAGFWSLYRTLPAEVRSSADKSYALLKSNPHHPSLHFKKIGRYWSARATLNYRVLGVERNDDVIWFWIGTHAEYDKLLKQA